MEEFSENSKGGIYAPSEHLEPKVNLASAMLELAALIIV